MFDGPTTGKVAFSLSGRLQRCAEKKVAYFRLCAVQRKGKEMASPQRVVIGEATLWQARWEDVYDLLPRGGGNL